MLLFFFFSGYLAWTLFWFPWIILISSNLLLLLLCTINQYICMFLFFFRKLYQDYHRASELNSCTRKLLQPWKNCNRRWGFRFFSEVFPWGKIGENITAWSNSTRGLLCLWMTDWKSAISRYIINGCVFLLLEAKESKLTSITVMRYGVPFL